MSVPRLRLLHETNPEKYFPALFRLAENGDVVLAGAHRYSIAKEWLRAALRDRTPWRIRTLNAVGDLQFRLELPVIRDEVIVLAFAPWDWRILIYRGLARRNRILYQTSWHDWRLDRTPRQPRLAVLKRWLRRQWLAFLAHPNVSIVGVTADAAEAVAAETGKMVRVIPHAVTEVFFEAGRTRSQHDGYPLRMLFVGEVAQKKGIGFLLDLMRDLGASGVTLTIVGNGSMAEAVGRLGGAVRFLGPIRGRAQVARVMAEHDFLVLPSRRTGKWQELFGIVIVEALAAGLAVLATDHVGPRGILDPARGAGLLPEDDWDAWRESILDLVADPAKLAQLRGTQAPVCATYHIDSVLAHWQKLIEI